MCRWRCQVFLLVMFLGVFSVAAITDNNDYVAVKALVDNWQNIPPNWIGTDPCGSNWEGIGCSGSRITSITLASMKLSGQLTGDIEQLTELRSLDLSYNPGLTGSLPPSIGNLKKLTSLALIGCSFNGRIPDNIGSLGQLVSLSLNFNQFIGEIPPSIGNLSKLYWLDVADNKLTGTIPVSDGNKPGLDMLYHTKHFHFGRNQLSGTIKPGLFNSNMTLIHVLFESNNLVGEIPSTLSLVESLQVLRLDNNSLSGTVPTNLNNLSNLVELFLSNNKLLGPVPDLTGLNVLHYLDMSNNTFNSTDVPSWFSKLQSLATLMMENTQLQGQLPVDLFGLPQLQNVVLRNNKINGTLNIGSTYSSQLQRVDLSNNNIDAFTQRAGYTTHIFLMGNPVCNESGERERYCLPPENPTLSYSTPTQNCNPLPCSSDQTSSPKCHCQYPYKGILYFRAPPSLSDLTNASLYKSLETKMMSTFQSNELPVDSVSLRNPTKNLDNYLLLSLEIFPSGQDYFNRTGVSRIGFMLSNQTFKPPDKFGPFFFIADSYDYFSGSHEKTHRSISIGVIIGVAVGGSVLAILLIGAAIYAFHQKKRAEKASKQNNPFASWDSNKHSGGVPQLKGARSFPFEELKKYTNNFSDANDIGHGGYGKVYRGILPDGKLVAIKRAHQGSMQGAFEFKNEIELLSRVHHRNLVALVGFCFEQEEQMLVYEYIANGSLKESLSGKSGIRLDWGRRLRITLGAARGLQYLHDLADPPIIHRDIKSNNILLDDRLVAKVSDFGLSKPLGDVEKGHVTTQVKGTMGYLDPEYYMTNQLTEKSDVYSFGVLMLELLTARSPIEKGKYIVREVRQATDKTKELYNLHGILDPAILNPLPIGLERFVDLAMRCVEESATHRPTMSEVTKEIESIMELVGLNPNAESATSSASYESASKGYKHPYSNESLFVYSGTYPPSDLEPK